MSLDHRTEIEGLRAIAALGVVAFHAGLTDLSGGFVGVDIFFVISGFLIARIILHDLGNGRFSLAGFYSRRARRILPALLTVVLVTLLAALFLPIPINPVLLSNSVIATVAFVSNIYFWSHTGYFGPNAHELPLLHTWSIGVEEQFYLLFPLSLLLLFRYARRALPIVIPCCFLASLALAAWAAVNIPSAAFYLIPFRAWELLLGASLAVVPLRDCGKLLGSILFVIGLGLIGFAYFQFDGSTAIPGLPALVPCAGAALIIYSGPPARQFAGRLIANPPLLWLGRISYSLYLWHWPPVVFIELAYGPMHELAWWQTTAFLVCLIVVSSASYLWIENPFRNPRQVSARVSIATVAGSAMLLLALGGVGMATNGFAFLRAAEKQVIAQYLNTQTVHDPRSQECSVLARFDLPAFRNSFCVRRDPSRPTLLFWGDSTLVYQMQAFRREAEAAGLAVEQASLAECRPTSKPAAEKCAEFTEYIRSLVLQQKPDLVVMSAQWDYTEPALSASGVQVHERALDLVRDLARHGISIVVLGPPVQYLGRLPEILLNSDVVSFERFDASPFLKTWTETVEKAMREAVKTIPGVDYISVIDATCPGGKCKVVTNGVPMTWDQHHLTLAGADYLSRQIVPRLVEIVKNRQQAIAR